MTRPRVRFRLLVVMLGMLYTAGATAAGLACAIPVVAAASMGASCGHNAVHDDCALACAAMCAAIAPLPADADTPPPAAGAGFWAIDGSVAGLRLGPEPPPPRLG